MENTFIRAREIVTGGFLRVAPVDTQYDPTLLGPYIDLAESKYIRDIIGRKFFEELKVKRTPNDISYNPAYPPLQIMFPNDPALEALFIEGKLFNLIAWGLINESLPHTHFQMTSMGVQTPTSLNANAAQGNEMRYLADRLKDNITFLTKEVQFYLCENKELYTVYGFNPEDYCDDCSKLKNRFQNNSTLPIWY
jgi:hypothetical protein